MIATGLNKVGMSLWCG